MSKACNQRIFAKDVKMPIDSGVGHKGRVEAEEMSSDQIMIIIFRLIFINSG